MMRDAKTLGAKFVAADQDFLQKVPEMAAGMKGIKVSGVPGEDRFRVCCSSRTRSQP